MRSKIPKPSSISPFSKEEQEAWNMLAQAYKFFAKLEQTHPSHQADFCNGIHACQGILSQRVLQRQFPNVYATYKEYDHGWELDDRSI